MSDISIFIFSLIEENNIDIYLNESGTLHLKFLLNSK